MEDVTILYYTSNREEEKFEKNIQKKLIENSNGLPIVSVSQKPIKLGTNICVGERPHSYTSEFMQIRIGLEAIKTSYVLTAESDFLYPPEYFTFTPNKPGICHRFYGVWIATDKFHFKGCSDGAQLIDRKMWLALINKSLPSRTNWNQPYKSCQKKHTDWENVICLQNPAISFKTVFNVSKKTATKTDVEPTTSIEYWGDINNLKNEIYERDTTK